MSYTQYTDQLRHLKPGRIKQINIAQRHDPAAVRNNVAVAANKLYGAGGVTISCRGRNLAMCLLT